MTVYRVSLVVDVELSDLAAAERASAAYLQLQMGAGGVGVGPDGVDTTGVAALATHQQRHGVERVAVQFATLAALVDGLTSTGAFASIDFGPVSLPDVVG